MEKKIVTKSLYGVLAEFDSTDQLLHAAEKTRLEGYKDFETFSPFPIHGMDDAMGLKSSKLGWIVFCGGACGLTTGFGLQTWAQVFAYPYIISGKPFFSYPAFVPVTFELMVLFSAFAAVFGMFALNGLPRFNHPLFDSPLMKNVTSHKFVLFISAKDKKFDREKSKLFIDSLKPDAVDMLETDND